jgi:hypothetical protein
MTVPGRRSPIRESRKLLDCPSEAMQSSAAARKLQPRGLADPRQSRSGRTGLAGVRLRRRDRRGASAGKEADRKAFDPDVGAEERPGQRVLAGFDVLLGGGDEQLVEVLAAEGAGGHLARGHRKLFL